MARESEREAPGASDASEPSSAPHASEAPEAPVETESGLPVEPVYGPEALAGFDPERQLGRPGEYPFTRGVYPTMYRGRPWTMRQYAGFGTAAETAARFRRLIAHGTTGLSVAFDLPTQMGYDSDAPQARGEVGRVGVAIDSLADMRTLLDGIPLERVSTSMTINAPAAPLLLLYQLVAEERGVDPRALTGTVQNDVLKEYVARGTYIFPPAPSLRLAADVLRYCRDELPRWNSISVSGYHMAEAGATPAQEVAFTLANALAYLDAAREAGMDVDEVAPRLSFFLVARTTLLEEVAKFRAARRIWARLTREELGARDPRSWRLRFHTQTAGVQLTAQQPRVNLVRVTVQALAAVLGGTQSLHTNAYDEALALPSEAAARLAVRTQQVLAHETDLTATVDPFAGSYAVEAMTNAMEKAVEELMRRVAERGGAVAAIEQGFQKEEIERAAYRVTRQVEEGERVVVGVNRFRDGRPAGHEAVGADGAAGADADADAAEPVGSAEEEPYVPLRVDPAIERRQAARLARLRAERDARAVGAALAALRRAAATERESVLPPMKRALAAHATVGEVCDALRDVWGVHEPPDRGRARGVGAT
ncbi:acyl-CoA mutase large subunit family protein [Streptomyces sp. 4N509B]|uniref:acyl-CoA mutase large subunit family protein n=1 Tax=Streptomyces sp. 4N509B TaxID=3457413 RepID=UPI003FCF86E7